MSLLLLVLWASAVAGCAVAAAWYARQFGRSDALMACYVTIVIASNLLASKIVSFDLGVLQVFAPAATLLFSVTFLLTDIVNERFGRAEAQRMIWIAVGSQILFLLFAYIGVSAAGAPFFMGQQAFDTVFANVPRIAAAGLITFLISESLDAYLFAWFRRLTAGRHLWMRNVFSSLPSMALDSALFIALAFYGTEGTPLLSLILGLTAIKWVVAVLDIPFMYLAREVLGSGQKKPQTV